jgi:hypothetical protein
VAPLNGVDTWAYNYMNAFDFAQTPLAPVTMVTSPEPAQSKAYLSAHPPKSQDT